MYFTYRVVTIVELSEKSRGCVTGQNPLAGDTRLSETLIIIIMIMI